MKECSKCGECKSFDLFYKSKKSSDGRRPDCKDCHNEQKRKKKEKDPVDYAIKILAKGIRSRTVTDVDKPKNKCYKDKGIKSLIGELPNEIYKFLKDNFYNEIKELVEKGITPSVDRIDPDKHYEIGNIRVIPLIDNTKDGLINAVKKTSKEILCTEPTGIEKRFKSVSEASRHYSVKRDTIIRSASKLLKTKSGYLFTYC